LASESLKTNFHSLLDELVVILAALTLRKKYFSESIDTPPFHRHLASTSITLPPIGENGLYYVKADTLVGKLQAGFFVANLKKENLHTIIYHHGSAERPFEFGRLGRNTFTNIFLSKNATINANLIAICAPFHDSTLETYEENIGRLSNLTAMVAVSVKLINLIVQYFGETQKTKVAVAGISLGGFVANLHRTYYNTADVYIPMLAGAALDDVFLNGEFRKLTDESALARASVLTERLNFEKEFTRIETRNIFPLLARYDRIVLYERQRQCYIGYQVKVLNKGHITGALSFNTLREHILQTIETCL